MARALQLARRGLYTTHPNPRVGCVLAAGERVIAEGWHRYAGEPHAEVMALQHAGALAQGAACYVTLEPCAHHGRTPPCSAALIAAGIARLVAAMEDPNPRVAGRGIAELRAAGIQTEVGLLAAKAEALNRGFVMRMRYGRPFIRCKLALSLDGRTAPARGNNRWITSQAAREDVHRLRAESAAILTGIGTVLADDPALTARPQGRVLEGRQPLRVVMDSTLRIPASARLLKQPGATLIVARESRPDREQLLQQAGAEVLIIEDGNRRQQLVKLMQHLAGMGVNELLVEAGPVLTGELLEAGLVDEFVFYLAPTLLGDGAQPLLRLPWMQSLEDRIDFSITDTRRIGRDLRIVARISQGLPAASSGT